MPSFIAYYFAIGDAELIGARKKGLSSRYGTREEAERRLAQVIENNGGPTRCKGEVREDKRPPEIFKHCGNRSQAVGCICPDCGKTVTRTAASQYKEK